MIVTAENLHKKFGRTEALNGASLAVPEGSAFALIGANGAGKTTTIKLLLNAIAPSKGRATVLGVDSRKLSPHELAQIGYVSEGQQLPQGLSVGAYLDYLRPYYPAWDEALEAALLAQFGLPRARRIGALSHGMRMKLAFAAALPYRPKLFILDEPFGGIDPLVRDELMAGLLQQAGETTIFISSHDLGEIEGMVSHVGYLERGKLLFQESFDDLGARIRDVRVTLERAVTLPPNLPAAWLNVAAQGAVVSFVDTRYAPAELGPRVTAVLGAFRQIDVEPLGLRQMFTALARSAAQRGT
ncbi:MAG TPA: ABC transporter ATP-binding protein [Rhizomicrobium sp.]|jgi:ABC-2 type transport system ATP-binding protein|nr:ABC transporter ATP-binding protein [Rhizomicrobium sp.]